jgi:hypothetical protein
MSAEENKAIVRRFADEVQSKGNILASPDIRGCGVPSGAWSALTRWACRTSLRSQKTPRRPRKGLP